MAKKPTQPKPPTYQDMQPDTWEWSAMRIIIANELDMHTGTRTKYEQLFGPGMWVPLARTAWAELKNNDHDWTPEQMVQLLASKQHDYGHENILRFGTQGVQVRLWDKIARYNNLKRRGVEPENEGMIDTLKDMIGYCVLMLMLQNNTFTLPLSGDLF